MDTVTINNPMESGFARVPHSLWELPVSIEAKAIFAYLLSFKSGATVRVALIEKALKIGRDKRRRAMAELEAVKIIERVTRRDASGRVLTNEMVVDTTPLLRSWLEKVGGESRPPENPSSGPENNRPPEKPAVGFSGPVGVETRPCRGPKSGDLYKTNNKNTGRKASPERRKAKPHRLPLESGGAAVPSWDDLGNFQRAYVRAGNPVPVPGVGTVRPDHPAYALWQAAHFQERQA